MNLAEICKSQKFYVYTHAKPDGQIFYVGKGIGIRAKDFCRRNDWHKKVTQKYGRDNIKICAYEVFDEVHAYAIERQLISILRKAGYELCNIDPGGQGRLGVRLSEEHKQKLRVAGLGHAVSKETRARIGAAGIGRKPSAAARMKMSQKRLSPAHREALIAATTGRKVSEDQKARAREKMVGRKLSDEHKEKLRISHLGQKPSKETLAKRSISLKAAWARRKGLVMA